MIQKETLLSRAREINSLMLINVLYNRRSLGKLLSNKNIYYAYPTFSKILFVARTYDIIRFDHSEKIIRYWKKEI